MSARPPCRREVIARRSRPTRRVSQTKNGTSANEISARRQSSSAIATVVAITVVAFCAIVVAVLVATLSMPPMSLAIRDWTSPRARAREERERQPLQVAVDGDAQVVHDALADLGRDVGLHDAQRRGRDRDRDHPEHELGQQRRVVVEDRPCRARRAAGTARSC